MPPNIHNCGVCSKSAKRIPSNKSGTVDCSVCGNWWHPVCVELYDAKIIMINDAVEVFGEHSWKCKACQTGLGKLAKEVKVLAVRLEKVENVAANAQSEAAKNTVDIEALKKQVSELSGKVTEVQNNHEENTGEAVLMEVTEGSSRERNIVLHGCEESDHKGDLDGVAGLLSKIGTRLGAPDVISVRRLGEVREKGTGRDSNRPLLAVMKSKSDRDEVLAAAPKLAKDEDEYYRKISIKADLTKNQRNEEANLYKQGEEKNLSRSTDQKSKNMAWKVIGRRGERSLKLVEMWEEEEVTVEGKVKRKEGHQEGQWEAARKRRRGGSGSKSPGSTRVAKTARFGGRGLEASQQEGQ